MKLLALRIFIIILYVVALFALPVAKLIDVVVYGDRKPWRYLRNDYQDITIDAWYWFKHGKRPKDEI